MSVRPSVRIGALAGIVTIFLALVGLIGDFTDVFLIGDEVTFAGLMLFLPAIGAGALAVAPRVEAGERRGMRLGEAATTAAAAATRSAFDNATSRSSSFVSVSLSNATASSFCRSRQNVMVVASRSREIAR